MKKFVLLLIIPFLSFGQQAIYGCLDENACNYNPEATVDNGVCTYPDLPYGGGFGYDCEGNCLLPDDMCSCEEIDFNQLWLIEGCWWNGGDPENPWGEPPFWIYPTTEWYEFDPINCAITVGTACGCLDENEDGWCDDINLLGCTDWTACNFDSFVIQDDGSCDYSCLCDTVFVTDTLYINNFITDTLYIDNFITDTIVEYIDVIITEYIDCETGLPCTSGMAEIIEKSKTNGKLYNLNGQEILRREGVYIEGGEVKYRLK